MTVFDGVHAAKWRRPALKSVTFPIVLVGVLFPLTGTGFMGEQYKRPPKTCGLAYCLSQNRTLFRGIVMIEVSP
jgi:hypothetical protein